MADPILDEIWRVREELVKEHGGIHGFLDYIEKLDRARRRRKKAKGRPKPRKTKAKGVR